MLFFNDTATTEIYTLSLRDALPILRQQHGDPVGGDAPCQVLKEFKARVVAPMQIFDDQQQRLPRSEEHTSELQSRQYLVCRLLLEKKTDITQLPVHLQPLLSSPAPT